MARGRGVQLAPKLSDKDIKNHVSRGFHKVCASRAKLRRTIFDGQQQ